MFGKRLKEIRKAKDLTLEELSDMYNNKFMSGLSKGTISKYENGKQEPMISVVNNLSVLLNVSTDYLLGNIDALEEFERKLNKFSEDADSQENENKNVIYNILELTKDENIAELLKNPPPGLFELIEKFSDMTKAQQQNVIDVFNIDAAYREKTKKNEPTD